ncbi:hypothetical protein O2K51_12040 [Apibacter raozihei]|uniref:hypothetical protein n=1 Tax=Apibacter raozihei TaxID=2500547 RepID=UPI000FE42863|nr:hypothetical protein [Apibacter raozihei]
MIKVKLELLANLPKSNIEVYDNINRIPLLLTVDTSMHKEESIYCRNLNGENFLELWFNKRDKKLKEVDLLALQENTVKIVEKINLPEDNSYYSCFIEINESVLEFSSPMIILRSDVSINILFKSIEEYNITYHYLTKECYIGITPDNYLISVGLSLGKEQIVNIFGF